METLQMITSEDLLDFGVLRGHIVRLRRALSEHPSAAADSTTAIMAPADKPVPVACVPVTGVPVRAVPVPVDQKLIPVGEQWKLAAAPCQEIDLQPVGDQLTAVQMSWERVKLLGPDKVGGVLCEHFFRIDSEMKAFFTPEVRLKYQSWAFDEADAGSDIRDSAAMKTLFGKKVSAVGYFIAGLSKKNMLPRVKQMGMRHLCYGGGKLTDVHFEKLERALMATLRQCLGDTFTPDVEVAWAMVFQFISAIMLCGHREALAIKAKAEQHLFRRQSTGSTTISVSSSAPPEPSREVEEH
uniref:Globin domain-containing protein n=1 Tax=Strombidinopsis acuminata TaxID=141414 RepID=A0A7S3U4N7_9SPIT|mmetsp:Transcript_87614/g.120764  ORF Transcript_87614/g.120764 Transcript_87614/m.120764 type:complete len:297 (+) Transcript_87614:3-893(+)